MPDDPLSFLHQRRSVPAKQLQEPGPDTAQLQRLLGAAIRVPDHGSLRPWRLIVLSGADKIEFGRRLADIIMSKNHTLSEPKKEKERNRYRHAPLVIAVIARLQPGSRIPEQEQLLSAGCLAYNLLLGAQALGFGAQWRTGWACYDRDVAQVLGLEEHEHVTAFIHIGTPRRAVPERRPSVVDHIVSTWSP